MVTRLQQGGRQESQSPATGSLTLQREEQRIVRTLKEHRGGNHELLAYQEDGRWHDVRSADINDYLHETAGDDFTAKDFRAWQATVLAAALLAGKNLELQNATSRRRAFTAVVKEVPSTWATRRRSAAPRTSTRG